jgi:hypothetical protein
MRYDLQMRRRIPSHHLTPCVKRHSHVDASVEQCCRRFGQASIIVRKQPLEENQ